MGVSALPLRGVLVEQRLDLARVDAVDVADAQRAHVAVALQVLVEERHLAEEVALAEHRHHQAVGPRHLHLPVADDVELVGGGAHLDDEVGGHVDLGGDREREHLELGLAERLEDGHRHQHVAVEREAHLAAQGRAEVLDEHARGRLLVPRPRVEPARLHALVDAVHLLLQSRLGQVDARDQHGDVTEDRRHHQRPRQHRHHRHGRAPRVGLAVQPLAQHHAKGVVQLHHVPLARCQRSEAREMRVLFVDGALLVDAADRVKGAREPVDEEEHPNEHAAEAHEHTGYRSDTERRAHLIREHTAEPQHLEHRKHGNVRQPRRGRSEGPRHHRDQVDDEPCAQVVCDDAIELDCQLATVILEGREQPEHEVKAVHDEQRRVEVRECRREVVRHQVAERELARDANGRQQDEH
eukprot:scaffold92105_cov72-Phaeocystis_antarctica.AAC.2